MRTTLLGLSSLLSSLLTTLEGLSMESSTRRLLSSSTSESSERGLGLGLLGTWRELNLQLNRTHNSNLLTQDVCMS